MKDNKNLMKFPNLLNLGELLPGQYGEATLPFKSSSAVYFVNL
jgi:hypothetical protein